MWRVTGEEFVGIASCRSSSHITRRSRYRLRVLQVEGGSPAVRSNEDVAKHQEADVERPVNKTQRHEDTEFRGKVGLCQTNSS